jgi:predicted glutamine amidotransferase
MCRILYARSDKAFSISKLLEPFAEMARDSREFQGHGWGCAWLDANGDAENNGTGWQQYHNIRPVWEDDPGQFGSTHLLLVHARSAFRDEGIVVENNMPFSDGKSVYIFNGELRGVRIQSEGRIGAEKIYNYIRRFDKGDLCAATTKAVDIIKKRSSYVRAMNIILSDGEQSCVSTSYSEDPAYFQMYRKQDNDMQLVCSRPLAGEPDWCAIENNTTIQL